MERETLDTIATIFAGLGLVIIYAIAKITYLITRRK